MFTSKSATFVTRHWLARDYMNDSNWITIWLGSGVYCIILCWASFMLLQSRLGIAASFSSGDCLILIQVFQKFGSYLSKLSGSVVSMQKGAVSIRRVSDLLRLPEHKSLLDQLSKLATDPAQQHGFDGVADADQIVLNDVEVPIPSRPAGLGPISHLKQKLGMELRIPLGKVVYVVGGTENRRLTFLSLLAKQIHPAKGTVTVPLAEWSILLPSVAVDLPDTTVKEDFLLAGASEEMALNLARAFDLDPDVLFMRLPPGRAATQALARSLVQDPKVLLAVRPLSSVAPELKEDVMRLLLIWQMGGGSARLMQMLSGGPCVENPLAPMGGGSSSRRTLVFSGEEVPDWIPRNRVHVFDISDGFECVSSVDKYEM